MTHGDANERITNSPRSVSIDSQSSPFPSALAADWPQFLGPTRNGVSTETGLTAAWPKKGPPAVWEKDVGEGFSGPVVVGERVILFHRVGDEEVVECLGAADGATKWKTGYPTKYQRRARQRRRPAFDAA